MKPKFGPHLPRVGGALALLAATLSVSGMAHAVGGATVGKTPVVPGQIVVHVPAGMTLEQVQALADGANCAVVRRFSSSDRFYVLRLKGSGAAASRSAALSKTLGAGPVRPAPVGGARGRSVRSGVDELYRRYGVMTQEMADAIVKLGQTAGVRAGADTIKVGLRQQIPSFRPNDPLYAESGQNRWHMDMMQMPGAWAVQQGVRTVRVAVVDSSIDPVHPDFRGADGSSRIVAAQNFYNDSVLADDDPANDTDLDEDFVTDVDGHGTHVAGTVAATTNNATGVAGVAGLARNSVDVRLVNARVFGAGLGAPSSVVLDGILWAADQNIDVMNLSLGGLGDLNDPNPAEQDAINQVLARGITIVAGAGNDALDANDPTQVFYPAEFPGVIKVTAVGPDRTLASYSNFGGQVAITAPGGDFADGPAATSAIWSTWPLNLTPDSGIPGYNAIQGTSMATPHVAGVATLIAAARPSRTLDAPQIIKQILQETATPLPDETPNFEGRNRYGAGLVNAYAAVLRAVEEFANPAPQLVGLDIRRGGGPGTYYTTLRQIGPTIRLYGIDKLLRPTTAEETARIEVVVATAGTPSTEVARYVYDAAPGGRKDFAIPDLTGDEKPATAFRTISLPPPAFGDVPLGENRYRITATLTVGGETTTDQENFRILVRRQPRGRSMFAYPYQVRDVTANPERTVLGGGFTLFRFDSFAAPAEGREDYMRFQSTADSGDNSALAGFSIGAGLPDPLTFNWGQGFGTQRASVAPAGIGYWLDLADEVVIQPRGELVPGIVAIRLAGPNATNGGGWNMIGNPTEGALNWSAISVVQRLANGSYTEPLSLRRAVEANILSGVLVGYQQGAGYVYSIQPEGTLEPFNAYWVQAKQDCFLLVPPAAGATRAAAVPLASDAADAAAAAKTRRQGASYVPLADGWRVRLSASVAGDVDATNYFGRAKGAAAGEDRLDIAKPPAGAGHAYVRFLGEGENGRKAAYAFDMRPEGNGREEWTAAVSSDKGNADVTLTWDGLGSLGRRVRLTLTDTVTGEKVAMGSRSSYTFRSGEAGGTRLFKIAAERQASAGALQILNLTTLTASGGRSAAGGGGMAVRFTTSRDADVTATLRTLGGKPVAQFGGVTRSAAMTEMTLRLQTTRSADGRPLAFGPYMIEVTARSADGEVTTVKRPVQYLR